MGSSMARKAASHKLIFRIVMYTTGMLRYS